MKVYQYVLLFVFMLIGGIAFVDLLVFEGGEGQNYLDIADKNRAYVSHFPGVLKPILGEEGVLFRFAGGFLIALPGLVFLTNYSTTKKQFDLNWGLVGVCVGSLMIWMSM